MGRHDTSDNVVRVYGEIVRGNNTLPVVSADGVKDYDKNKTQDVINAEVDTALSGKYQKPVDGIPKSDLAEGVQESLNNADSALQSQEQADWNESDSTKASFIKNKPAAPAAQVNADWNASSGVAEILNKPTTIAGYGITDSYTKTEGQALESEVDSRLDAQDAAIALLNGSDVVVVADHTDATEVPNPDPQKIYREPEAVVEPAVPSYYIDWMYNNGTWKGIAKYDFPGVDDEPTAGSDNLVKSGGVKDALSELGYYVEDAEWVRVVTDSEENVLAGIKSDGSVDWVKGVPRPVKEYIDEKIGGGEDSGAMQFFSSIENPEYAEVHMNDEGSIAYSVKQDGTFLWYKGIPEHLKKYIEQTIHADGIALKKPSQDNLCPFKCDGVEGNWKGLNTMLFLKVQNWSPFYNNLSDYISVINNYNPSIVRTITWQDIEIEGVLEQYDTVLYYIAKSGKDIMLSTQQPDYEFNLTGNLDPLFEKIEFLARRYNGTTLIKPEGETEGVYVRVKYWEFTNEINNKTAPTVQLQLQQRFYQTIKSVDPNYIVMSHGYASENDAILFELELTGGHKYQEYYDIYNFHVYKDTIKDFIAVFDEHLKGNTCALQKEFWLTEFGKSKNDNPSLEESYIANYNVQRELIALSYGASKCLYWANESLVNKNAPSDYYSYYDAMTFLFTIHGTGATKPILECNNGVYSVRWIFNNTIYTALFAEENIDVDVIFNQQANVYDCFGNSVNTPIHQVGHNIIYIENSENVILKFN